MTNEFILIINLIFVYSSVLIWLKFWGKTGLICFNLIATITANIEVMILVDAFGMQQTLGNVLFASTFLITDILSELYDKKTASEAVNIGIFATVFFVLISQTWFLYTPSINDLSSGHLKKIFSKTPRIMVSGIIVYGITQYIDVLLYHLIWKGTARLSGSKEKFLWLRNNLSTLFSQFVNTLLFTLLAFGNNYDFPTLMNIITSSYIIFVFTSLADTPILYLAKLMYKNKKIRK